jgi:hypothetical protein
MKGYQDRHVHLEDLPREFYFLAAIDNGLVHIQSSAYMFSVHFGSSSLRATTE